MTINNLERSVSMVVGGAIGDTFGVIYENVPLENIRLHDFSRYQSCTHPESRHKSGQYTDDTQFSMANAELLLSGEPYTPTNVANYLLMVYQRDKRPFYSPKTLRVLETAKTGEEYLSLIDRNSEKNGAVMRSVNLGLLRSIDDVISHAVINAKATHDSPNAICSSVAVALASHYFLYCIGNPENVIEFCLDNMIGFSPKAISYLRDVNAMSSLNRETLLGKEHMNFGVPNRGIIAAGAALYTVSRHYDCPFDALKQAVTIGGDTDTVASITMGIAASRTGTSCLPKFLIDGMENGQYGRDYLINLGKRLAAIMPLQVNSFRRLNYPGKRKNMIIQDLDGLVDRIEPVYLEELMKQLLRKLNLNGVDYIIGVDASGYIPATAASLITGIPLKTTKKALLDIGDRIKFEEPGTPNPENYVYNLPHNSRVIIIDDEIMTGNTIVNLINSLSEHGATIEGVVIPVESTMFGARQKIEGIGIKLVTHTTHNFE